MTAKLPPLPWRAEGVRIYASDGSEIAVATKADPKWRAVVEQTASLIVSAANAYERGQLLERTNAEDALALLNEPDLWNDGGPGDLAAAVRVLLANNTAYAEETQRVWEAMKPWCFWSLGNGGCDHPTHRAARADTYSGRGRCETYADCPQIRWNRCQGGRKDGTCDS